MPGRIALASLASAAALLAGSLGVHLLPWLPDARLALAAALVVAVPALFVARSRLAALLLLGFAWTAWHAAGSLALRLPHALEGRDLALVVDVVDLPRIAPDAVRFDARIVEARDAGGAALPVAGRVRLAWYGAAAPPMPGARLALTVRLKRPRGVVNPGGFDFERFALERRYAATGYVREGRVVANPGGDAIGRLRLGFSRALRARFDDGSVGALLAALAVGDQSGLSERDWDVLRATGTAHLIAISGLHVGMVAGLGALLARLVFVLRPTLALRIARRRVEAVAAFGAAFGYGLLAGMSLPVQRTLLMIAVLLLAAASRRALPPSQGLALAAIVLVLADPLALLGAGFWLSLGGVAWLVFCLANRPVPTLAEGFTRAQWAMSIGLLPLTVWFFQQSALAGPIANLAAVPWISFVVVPLLLLALGAWLALPMLFAPVAQVAAWAMAGIWSLLEIVAGWRWAEVHLPEPTLATTSLAIAGALVLLLPRAVPGRALGGVLLLPLLWPVLERPAAGQFDLRVLDVGQGLAVLVTTARHDLLYDAGPRFRSGFDMGDAAVVPAVRALGIARLDRLVVSHGDSDHAGGAESVAAALHPRRSDVAREGTRCRAGERWRWDGVTFEFLHPAEHFPELDNDSSCVLRIAAGGHAVLLPGDVSTLVEERLLRDGAPLTATVLVSPHHGSRSSSGAAFVAATAPRVVIHSTGARNRFGHPAAEVRARYRDAGVLALDTARDGAIRARLGPHGLVALEESRELSRRYWRE